MRPDDGPHTSSSVPLSENVEPLEAVIDQANNHRDDDDSYDPTDESVNEAETRTEDLKQDITCPVNERVIAESRGRLEGRRRGSDECWNVHITLVSKKLINSTEREPVRDPSPWPRF